MPTLSNHFRLAVVGAALGRRGFLARRGTKSSGSCPSRRHAMVSCAAGTTDGGSEKAASFDCLVVGNGPLGSAVARHVVGR